MVPTVTELAGTAEASDIESSSWPALAFAATRVMSRYAGSVSPAGSAMMTLAWLDPDRSRATDGLTAMEVDGDAGAPADDEGDDDVPIDESGGPAGVAWPWLGAPALQPAAARTATRAVTIRPERGDDVGRMRGRMARFGA